MGDIQRGLFGGSKSSSQETQSSINQAFPYLQGALSPVVSQGAGASSQLANLLGLGGGPAQEEGFDKWRGSTGYNFGLKQGTDALTGSAASRGILNSGSAARALTQFGQDYASSKYKDYTDLLSGLTTQGIQSGGVISSAGTVSQGQKTSKESSTKNGFGGIVGSLMGK